MRTTLDLPDPLFRSLKARAAMDGTSLKDLVVRLVQAGLAQSTQTAHLKRSPLPVLVSGPIAAMTNAQLYALLDGPDDAKSIAFARGLPQPDAPD